ncbi:MAG: hypothetical protein QY323_05255 [Patescibacteria group bacterium]|nr:MAG: hypothetical protein QY323_05255 [Patescibacteria group bacterium]
MRGFKRFLLVMLVLGVLAGAGFGVLWVKHRVEAYSLENIVVEPAPPQPKPPEEKIALDERLEGLLSREDEARLLYAPEPGTKILSAAFIDNGTLMLTTSAAQGKETRWNLERFDIASATSVQLLGSTAFRLASSHRPAHRNVNRFCYSERDAKRGVFEIWCADLDGRNAKQITTHDGKEDLLSPAISPDGAWIAFEVLAERPKPQGSTIWKVRLDGSDLQQLTRGADDRRPSWSDDGRKIYFQRRPIAGGTSWDMYGMDADGKNSGPLLRTHEEDESFLARRAATDTFVVVESASGVPARLKLIDAVTKAGEYLTAGTNGSETSPSVSPDGRVVAFIAPISADQPDALAVWLAQIKY